MLKAMKLHLLNPLFTGLIALSMVLTSCATGIQGSGNVIKQERKVSSFTSVDVSGFYQIYLRQGNTADLTIVADDNLLGAVNTFVENNTLHIQFEETVKDYTELKAFITVSKINEIEISGACELESKNTITTDSLVLSCSGASEIKMEVNTGTLAIDASGASEMILKGNSYLTLIEASGASAINAFDLKNKAIKIDVSGATEAKLYATEKIFIEASGASSVTYKGNPKSIHTDASGASSIKKAK